MEKLLENSEEKCKGITGEDLQKAIELVRTMPITKKFIKLPSFQKIKKSVSKFFGKGLNKVKKGTIKVSAFTLTVPASMVILPIGCTLRFLGEYRAVNKSIEPRSLEPLKLLKKCTVDDGVEVYTIIRNNMDGR